MKIYFSCSITGGRKEEGIYQALVEEMLKLGYEVPTAHLSGSNIMELESLAQAEEIFNRDMNWLQDCDVVVAEVTTPSHGVGYEIAIALTSGKPVFCCYQQGRKVSKILTGNTSPNLAIRPYESVEEAKTLMREFLGHIGQA
jgi:nucleoside 2-deoxyribosyltransferase